MDSEAVEDVTETDLAQDISAEDTYALTGEVDEESQDIASLDENEDGDVAAEEGTDAGQTVMASTTVGVGLVSEAKVTREQNRSRNKEILMELINSTNITDEQKQSAIDEMVAMTDAGRKGAGSRNPPDGPGFDEVVVKYQ